MKLKLSLKGQDTSNLYPLFFTLIFILILLQYSFNSLDALFYDFYIKANAFKGANNEIILVTLDEESDQFLGEIYPYTYATHSRFFNRLLKEEPTFIGQMVAMDQSLTDEEKAFSDKIINQINEYVAKGGIFRFGTDKDLWGESIPPGELAELGYSLALINKDGSQFSKDGITRRAILNFSGQDSFHLWASKKILAKKGVKNKEAAQYQGAYYNQEADATFALFKYDWNPLKFNAVKEIPFHRIVVGNFPEGYFKDKIILIGPQYISNITDFVKTPFGDDSSRISKLNVHAQIINALINFKTIYEIPDRVSSILAIFIAFMLSLYISRVQPARGLLVTMLLMIILILLTLLGVVLIGVWLKISHIILSIFVVYYIWVPFRAIGEYQRRYAFEEEARVLKKVDSLKQNFISLMSHDLKTPVAKIAGIVDILKTQYNNSDGQAQLLKNISNATLELNNFINSILDLTKIESRELTLNLESKDINVVIEQVVDQLKFESNESNIEIVMTLEPLYPIKMDEKLIHRVISNLVGNAIKYSGYGKKIQIKAWDDQDWVYVQVKDDGVGISKEDQDHIFDKFYRVKNDETHKIKGSGLGLYLVKYFIELHEGKIVVESSLGEGTSFTLKLKNQ